MSKSKSDFREGEDFVAIQIQRAVIIGILLSMAVVARPAMSQNERGASAAPNSAVVPEDKPIAVRNDAANCATDGIIAP